MADPIGRATRRTQRTRRRGAEKTGERNATQRNVRLRCESSRISVCFAVERFESVRIGRRRRRRTRLVLSGRRTRTKRFSIQMQTSRDELEFLVRLRRGLRFFVYYVYSFVIIIIFFFVRNRSPRLNIRDDIRSERKGDDSKNKINRSERSGCALEIIPPHEGTAHRRKTNHKKNKKKIKRSPEPCPNRDRLDFAKRCETITATVSNR